MRRTNACRPFWHSLPRSAADNATAGGHRQGKRRLSSSRSRCPGSALLTQRPTPRFSWTPTWTSLPLELCGSIDQGLKRTPAADRTWPVSPSTRIASHTPATTGACGSLGRGIAARRDQSVLYVPAPPVAPPVPLSCPMSQVDVASTPQPALGRGHGTSVANLMPCSGRSRNPSAAAGALRCC